MTYEGPIVRARIARSLRPLVFLRGWRRLINRLVPEHSAPFSVANGETMFAGNISSYVDRQVYLFGGYESAEIRAFLSRVPPERRGNILDVGANVGTHSLAFARVFDTVHAFEPNPNLWHQFERNVELNGLTNVHLHQIGLADRDADLTLRAIDKPNFGLGTFAEVEQYDRPLRPVATCSVRQGSKYLSEIGVGSVDAVKIDVQGFEPEVLRGLSDVLKRNRPVVWCEIGAGTMKKVATTSDLSTLLPFQIRAFQMVSNSKARSNSVGLLERSGNLPAGNYLLLPVR
jgi:FkbM family methyltransferase